MSAIFTRRPSNCAFTSAFVSGLPASPLIETMLHILSAVFVISSRAFCGASRFSALAISCVICVAAITSNKSNVRAFKTGFPDESYEYCIIPQGKKFNHIGQQFLLNTRTMEAFAGSSAMPDDGMAVRPPIFQALFCPRVRAGGGRVRPGDGFRSFQKCWRVARGPSRPKFRAAAPPRRGRRP